jgi:hypothetical protein
MSTGWRNGVDECCTLFVKGFYKVDLRFFPCTSNGIMFLRRVTWYGFIFLICYEYGSNKCQCYNGARVVDDLNHFYCHVYNRLYMQVFCLQPCQEEFDNNTLHVSSYTVYFSFDCDSQKGTHIVSRVLPLCGCTVVVACCW